MKEEMQTHLALRTERNIAAGMPAEEARYAALREFGNVTGLQETARSQRGWTWLEVLGKDLSFAARSLTRNAGFTAIVVLTLALGIGCSAALFTAIDALMLRRLPVRDPAQLVVIEAAGPVYPNRDFPYPLFDKTGVNRAFPFSFYESFREKSLSLSDVVAVGGWMMSRPMVATGFGSKEVEPVNAEEVSGNYFSALGISSVLGRTLGVADDRLGGTDPVAVISHEYWRSRFGSDPSVVGKTLKLDDVTVTIVGVLAPGFTGMQVGIKANLWFPIQWSPLLDGNVPWGNGGMKSDTLPWIHILGRMRPGISRHQAASELDVIFQQKLAQLDPRRAVAPRERSQDLLVQGIATEPAGSGYAGLRPFYEKPVFLLMVMVGFMHLVACANVAGLLLARGAARRREFALRTALGASRSRLVGQLMVESLLLSALAGSGGLLLAEGSTRILARYVGGIELWADWRVLGFVAVATTLTGIAFGLVPALHLSRRELTSSLKDQGTRGRQRLNFALVILQIGFAFLLLSVAGLFARTLRNVSAIDTGFQRRHRQLFDLNVPSSYKPDLRFSLCQRIEKAVEALPGVESVTTYQGLNLLGDMALVEPFSVGGFVPGRDEVMAAGIALVGPNFFQTMGIPLLRGRDFGPRDEDSPSHEIPPVVISEWSAKRLFGASDPIGRRIRLNTDFVIVGVARDIKYGQLREAPRFEFYLPIARRPDFFRTTFAVKTGGTAAALAENLPSVIHRVDAQAQIGGLRTIEEKMDEGTAVERLSAHLTGFFGVSALLLSGLGLFGLLSYNVTCRTREIGTRVALGAPVGSILLLVSRQGFEIGLLGCGVGLVGAFACTRFLEGFLYGVPSVDLLTFSIAAIVLLAVAVIACALPARRAAKVNPIEALRAE
jgi:predicted permease